MREEAFNNNLSLSPNNASLYIYIYYDREKHMKDMDIDMIEERKKI